MQQKVLNGRYELLGKLGEGGMARVYRGRDLRLGRPVAVKVLHSHYAGDPSFLHRFEHEARSAASLSGPHIVDVYDVGQDGDLHYIVMELVEGADLKSLIKTRAPLSIDQAVLIAAAVAEGLQTAHDVGLVHRDVKPQNILVTPQGRVRITDFGIAKSHLSSAVTEAGVTFGTADYISPEQAQGQNATPRSDIYSLGVVLFEMLTGQLPFTGESSVAVATRHVRDEPPSPRHLNPQVPTRLEQLVLRALAKDPEQRPASALEFAHLLREYLNLGSQETMLVSSARPDGQNVASDGRRQGAPASGSGARKIPPPPRSSAPQAPPRSGGSGCGGLAVALAVLIGVGGLIFLLSSNLLSDSGRATGVAAVRTAPLPEPSLTVSPLPAAVVATGTATRRTTPSATRGTPTPSPSPTLTATPIPSVTLDALLLGRTERELLLELERLRLTPVTAEPVYDESIPEGNVVALRPGPGTPVPVGGVITYTLSRGPLAVPVPDLRGSLQAAAESELRRLGFAVRLEQTPSQGVPAGYVIDQVPPGNSRLARGETVTLFVSVGDQVRVPDVFLKNIGEARFLIEQAGLNVQIDCQDASRAGDQTGQPPGTVISFTPSADSFAARGSTVILGVRGDSPEQCGL
jgi:serine/threonine-protein kinase